MTGVQQDFAQKRIGMNPPAELRALCESAGLEIASACGVHPSLLSTAGDGTSQRESWKRFIHGSVRPITRMIEHELRAKLNQPTLKLRCDSLGSVDLTGRARSFQSLVKAGHR